MNGYAGKTLSPKDVGIFGTLAATIQADISKIVDPTLKKQYQDSLSAQLCGMSQAQKPFRNWLVKNLTGILTRCVYQRKERQNDGNGSGSDSHAGP